MPNRNYRRPRSRQGVVRQPPEQEATLAREQASRAAAGPAMRQLKEEKGTKPTITLQDDSVVEADLAVCIWNSLKEFSREEPAAFLWLLAQAQGRTGEADARHILEALEARGFVNEDRTIDPVTCAVLVNAYTIVDGAPIVAALRFNSASDKAVFEQAQAQLQQNMSEDYARSVSPGGWFDQLMKKRQQDRGKGQSIE